MSPSSAINPFVVGGAINASDGKGFYGRDDIFEFVNQSLNTARRAPILLIGQRRIGKSSVLKQLQAHLPADFVSVFYDLQGRAELTLDEVLFGLGRAIADALGIARPQPEEATAESFPLWMHRAFKKLDDHPERLVLLFDEFDVVDQKFAQADIAAKRFIPYLAEMVAKFPQVGYILVVGRRSKELSDNFFNALLRQTVQMRIGRLDRGQTRRLVMDSFGTNLRVSESGVEEIYSLTAGHPFCVQILCSTIWNLFIAKVPAAEIRVHQVDQAVQIAVQQWTNGLNWNYDGFEESSHRLFLSALAMLSGENAREPASFAAIQNALLERRVGIDEAKLRSIPHDLQNWDVIEGNTAGLRFTVPLIGVWVQKERPLQGYEQETRLINPRAAKYYDLATDSQLRGSLSEAIEDFRNALEANPVFLDAQMGLAVALRARKEPGDFDAAIEAYERVLELDPASPRGTLLDMLVEAVESSQADAPQAIRRYKRIVELEPNGRAKERANRILEQMALARFTYGKSERLQEAINLWRATGNDDEVESARKNLNRLHRANNICIGLWIVFTLTWGVSLALPPSWLLIKMYGVWLSLALAAFASQALFCATAIEYDGVFTFRRMGWIGTAIGLAAGIFASRWIHSRVVLGVIEFFLVGISNTIINQDSDRRLPPEMVKASTGDATGSIRSSVSQWLILMGARLGSATGGPVSGPTEPKDNGGKA